MEPVLKSLMVKRFRSVRGCEVVFSNPTFLVGQNGAGKSNLVDALAILAEAMTQPLQAVFDRRGGAAALAFRPALGMGFGTTGIGVTLGRIDENIEWATYGFELISYKTNRIRVTKEQCVIRRSNGELDWFTRGIGRRRFDSNRISTAPSLDPSALVFPLIGGDSHFRAVTTFLAMMRFYAIQPVRMRELQDPDPGTSLKVDGSNSASVLSRLKRVSKSRFQHVAELMEAVVPDTIGLGARKHGNKTSIQFSQSGEGSRRVTFDALQMSEGTLRALGVILALNQEPKPSVVVVEEPESTIHTGAMGVILDAIRDASRSSQVVITTHSTDLLDAKWISDEYVRIVVREGGATRVSLPSPASRTAIKNHLMGVGDLLRANALAPASVSNPNEDILKAIMAERTTWNDRFFPGVLR